jgi:esterase
MQLFHKKLGEQGQAIVILHGLFGSSDNWLTIGKALSEQYQVYLLDLPNHGRSPHSDQFNYKAMVEAVEQFIQEEKIENPVIIGHSMGGKVAMNFALQHPELFDKLIVVDIAPRYYPVHHDQILEGLMAVDIDHITSRQEADEQLARYEPHPTVRMFLLKNLYRDENQKFDWRLNLPVIDAQIDNVGEAVSDKKSIQNPVLFINGVKSDYILPEDEPLIHKLFPDAAIKAIQGAGHWCHAEKPEEFLALVKSFLEKS